LNVQLPLFDGLAHPLNHCFIILRRKKLLQIFFFNFFNILLLKINLKNIKNIIYIYIYMSEHHLYSFSLPLHLTLGKKNKK
jgi:hypothetical protein